MQKAYILIPLAALAGFVGIERHHQREREAAEAIRVTLAREAALAEDKDRQEKQRLAAEDMRRRTAERERQEQERAAKQEREFAALLASQQQQAETEEEIARDLAAEATALTMKLNELRARRDAASHEAFELARSVSLQRVDRRNAELELQRTTTMVAARLKESTWVNPPTAAPESVRR
jgi:hypothetical protein